MAPLSITNKTLSDFKCENILWNKKEIIPWLKKQIDNRINWVNRSTFPSPISKIQEKHAPRYLHHVFRLIIPGTGYRYQGCSLFLQVHQ